MERFLRLFKAQERTFTAEQTQQIEIAELTGRNLLKERIKGLGTDQGEKSVLYELVQRLPRPITYVRRKIRFLDLKNNTDYLAHQRASRNMSYLPGSTDQLQNQREGEFVPEMDDFLFYLCGISGHELYHHSGKIKIRNAEYSIKPTEQSEYTAVGAEFFEEKSERRRAVGVENGLANLFARDLYIELIRQFPAMGEVKQQIYHSKSMQKLLDRSKYKPSYDQSYPNDLVARSVESETISLKSRESLLVGQYQIMRLVEELCWLLGFDALQDQEATDMDRIDAGRRILDTDHFTGSESGRNKITQLLTNKPIKNRNESVADIIFQISDGNSSQDMWFIDIAMRGIQQKKQELLRRK